MRFEPDGFFASVVVLGGAAYIPLQVIAVLGDRLLAGPSAACAAATIIGASLAAWRARKIPRWFGQAGIAGGVAVLAVGPSRRAPAGRSQATPSSRRRSASWCGWSSPRRTSCGASDRRATLS